MRLEQLMTTGGGWQDQAGGIFPGAKLVVSGPGLSQKLRVQPVPSTAEAAAEFESLLVLYYTGIRRIARGLLQQVVEATWAARRPAAGAAQHQDAGGRDGVRHGAARLGPPGELLDRHWELNKILDPNTTNAAH